MKSGNYVRLTRSTKDRVIGGVAGGIAQYLNIDPILIRLAFVVLALVSGTGVMIYSILWLLIPEETSKVNNSNEVIQENAAEMKTKAKEITDSLGQDENRSRVRVVVGLIIVVLGILAFLKVFGVVDLINITWLWPIILIIIGLLLITKGGN